MKNILRLSIALITVLCLYAPVMSADTESLYNQGIEAFNSRNYGSAELIFNRIIDTKDDEYMDQAWFYLARSIYHQKKYKSALYEFNSFLNHCTISEKCIESRFWMGESYYNLKDYVKAIEQYKRYIMKTKKGPLVTASHDRIGSIYFTQERYDEAIIEWERAIDISNDRDGNALRILHIGEALYCNEKYDVALHRLTPLLTATNNIKISAKARLICGRIYQIQDDHKKALLILNGIPGNLLKEKPFHEANYFKGVSNLALGNRSAAKSLFEIFILMGKESDWYYNALLELGKILSEDRDWKKGAVLLEDVRKSSSKPEFRFQASRALSSLYMKHDPAAAIPYLQESLTDENPEEHKEALLILAKVYINVKDFNKALESLNVFMDKYPFDKRIDEAVFLKAVLHLEKGEMSNALSLFEKIENEYPFSKYVNESKLYLARVHFENDRYKEALNYALSYLKIKNIEHRYEAYILLVQIHIEMNNISKADRIMTYVTKSFSGESDIDREIFNFAEMLKQKNRNPWSYYTILMKKYPDSGYTLELYMHIAYDYFKKQSWEKAYRYYTLYLNKQDAPERGTAFFQRLLCLSNMKKYDDVINEIQQKNIPPMNEQQWREIPLLLSRSYYHTGNLDKVYNILYASDMTAYKPEDVIMFVKSAIHMEDLGSANNSLVFLQQHREYYCEAFFLIGRFLQKNEEYNEALETYAVIINKFSDMPYVEKAKIETADIYVSQKRYADAIDTLHGISSPDLQTRKNSMLIHACFDSGNTKKALALTEDSLNALRSSEFGESVFRKNLTYYYNNKDRANFKKYSRYLMAYNDSKAFVHYWSGKFYYRMKYFKSAAYFFGELSKMDSPYSAETLFYLASIHLHVNRKWKTAIWYYKKVVSDAHATESLKLNSKINLAIIYMEYKKESNARSYLNDVINSSNRGYLKRQAQNLYEYYGFAGEYDE